MSGWPWMQPRIPSFAMLHILSNCLEFPSHFLYAARNSMAHRLSTNLARVILWRNRCWAVALLPTRHRLLKHAFIMLRAIDFVMCLVQSPFTVFTPCRAMTSSMPFCRWESPSVTNVPTASDAPPSITSSANNLPRWYSEFPIASLEGKFFSQLSLCTTGSLPDNTQLQTLLRVWEAMGMCSRPGSPAKHGAHDCMPGW